MRSSDGARLASPEFRIWPDHDIQRRRGSSPMTTLVIASNAMAIIASAHYPAVHGGNCECDLLHFHQFNKSPALKLASSCSAFHGEQWRLQLISSYFITGFKSVHGALKYDGYSFHRFARTSVGKLRYSSPQGDFNPGNSPSFGTVLR